MAKTKQKSKDKAKKGTLQVRRVKSAKDRKSGGYWTRLKTDESFKAYALFIADPEAENNPGYYEYFEHYYKPDNAYVPCAGDDCPWCELGDSPSVRASTLWYFPDNPNGEKLKVLKLNGYLIRDFAEIEAEEGGTLGRKFRVKRLSDDGKYRVSPQTDKKLTKAEIKALIKSALSKSADENSGTTVLDLEQLALRTLRAALEQQDAVESLTEEDDDDDDDEDEEEETEKPKSRRGKAKKEEEDDDDDEDEDEDEEDDDDEDENEDDDDDEEEDDDEDESDDDEEESDDDDDEDDEEEDDDDEEDEEDENNSLSGEKFEVVSTKEADETITVKIDGKNAKLWVGEGVDVDWDVVKKGAEITIDADPDDEGDLVITKLKVKAAKADKKPAGKGGKGKKDTKKGGKKK